MSTHPTPARRKVGPRCIARCLMQPAAPRTASLVDLADVSVLWPSVAPPERRSGGASLTYKQPRLEPVRHTFVAVSSQKTVAVAVLLHLDRATEAQQLAGVLTNRPSRRLFVG